MHVLHHSTHYIQAAVVCVCHACRYVARKTVKPQAFPLTRWEFFGSTSLLEMAGYLDVPTPGSYEIAATSEDRFVVWLQDWWLHRKEASADSGLPQGSWKARANFATSGERCRGDLGVCSGSC